MPDRDAALAAVLAFKRRQLVAAVDTVEELDGGAIACWTPALPRVWELNLVVAPPAEDRVDIERLLELADGVQTAAGLAHRKLRFDAAAPVEPLAAAAETRGWTVDRELLMVRDCTRATAASGEVEDLDHDALAAAEDEFLAAEPYGGDPDARRQLIVQHERWARVAGGERALGIVEHGAVVGWCRLYDDGELVEFDSVGVLPAERGRGLGRALVEGAIAAVPEGRVAFLGADPDDWPRELYARLGFEAVGERLGATRAPVPDVDRSPL